MIRAANAGLCQTKPNEKRWLRGQEDAVQSQVVEKQSLHCIPSDLNIRKEWINFIFISASVRTWFFVHFILPQICLQTRHNLTQDFQKDWNSNVAPHKCEFLLRVHYWFAVITNYLICTEYFCFFDHSSIPSMKDVGCQTFTVISVGRFLPSLQSATPIQTERSDEGGQNRTENSLLLLNYDVFDVKILITL